MAHPPAESLPTRALRRSSCCHTAASSLSVILRSYAFTIATTEFLYMSLCVTGLASPCSQHPVAKQSQPASEMLSHDTKAAPWSEGIPAATLANTLTICRHWLKKNPQSVTAVRGLKFDTRCELIRAAVLILRHDCSRASNFAVVPAGTSAPPVRTESCNA